MDEAILLRNVTRDDGSGTDIMQPYFEIVVPAEL
jgi:hypothetical protein